MDRDTIIAEAIDRCLTEMFSKAQPSANWHEYVEKAKRGEIDKNEKIYERHYLNETQFNYIANKYKNAYRCINEWRSNIEFLLDCFENGGYRTVYEKSENGSKTRTSEKTPVLTNLIGEENAAKVIELINDLRNFYRFDREEETFNWHVYLGCSPTSNAQTVKDYWKSQGKDIEIDETELTEDEYWELDEFGHLVEDEEE